MYACMYVGHAADLQTTGIISVSCLFHDKQNYYRDGRHLKCERFAGRPYAFSQTKNKYNIPSYKRISAEFGVEPNIMQPLCLLLYRSDSIICICGLFYTYTNYSSNLTPTYIIKDNVGMTYKRCYKISSQGLEKNREKK